MVKGLKEVFNKLLVYSLSCFRFLIGRGYFLGDWCGLWAPCFLILCKTCISLFKTAHTVYAEFISASGMLNLVSICLDGWSVQFLSTGMVGNLSRSHLRPQQLLERDARVVRERRRESSARKVHTRHPDGEHHIFLARSCTACGYLIRRLLISRECIEWNSSNSSRLFKIGAFLANLTRRVKEAFLIDPLSVDIVVVVKFSHFCLLKIYCANFDQTLHKGPSFW